MAAKRPNPPHAPRPSRPFTVNSDTLLAVAVGLSLLLHGLAMSLHFLPPKAPAARPDKGLEVVLVNARHQRAPQDAEKLAQANLDGGGNSDQQVTPKTPLPPQERRRDGDALVEARKRVQQLEQEQKRLLTQRAQGASLPRPKDAPEQAPVQPAEISGMELLDSAAAIARMEAQIDKRLEEYAKRPRRTALGSRVKEYRFAQYVEAWRQKVERIGTLNYPEQARGKLYGSLLLAVNIKADGSLEKVEILRSSGHKVLDEAALRIVRLGEPYANFPPDIRKDTDILEIVRTWTFTNREQLTSSAADR